MQSITAPVVPGDTGPAVVNLQDGLRRLLTGKAMDPPGDLGELMAALGEETKQATYGDATSKVVEAFQQQQKLEASGQVDAPTAEALNAILRDLGGLDAGGGDSPEVLAVLKEQSALLQGIQEKVPAGATVDAIREGTDHLPLVTEGIVGIAQAGTVLGLGSRGATVTDLQAKLVQAGFTPPQEELESNVFGAGTLDAVLRLQEKYDLTPTGVIEPATRAALGIAADAATDLNRIEGRVLLENGLPARGVQLRAVNRGFGGTESEIGTVATDDQGFYALSYEADGALNNLEIHAVGPGDTAVSLSDPKAGIQHTEVLNLIAPPAVAPLDAEYARLAADLAPHVDDITNLGSAKENDEGQDLATLHRDTGWDARVLALAANAAQLRTASNDELSHEGLYAALRAGLPSDPAILAQVQPEVVKTAVTAARDAGVVAMTDDAITAFTGDFQTFADRTLLTRTAPGSMSSYSSLLASSGLTADEQTAFASVYLRSGGEAGLWESGRQAKLSDAKITQLQRHGQFAFLSGNSAPMTAQLMTTEVEDPAGLVGLDLYEPEKWKEQARAAAGGDGAQLDALIPTGYVGDDVEQRLDSYAKDTARKLRLAYPTHVVGRLLERDEQDDFALGELRGPTAAVLKGAAQQGYQLGRTPAATFFDTHPGATGGLEEAQLAAVLPEVKKLHRVYQITPDNESMPILLSLGLHSAHEVVAVDEDRFVDLYGSYFPTEQQARLVHRKATQVAQATYTMFGIAATSGIAPAVRGVSAGPQVREQARNDLVKQFPTLESLFGSMDYCECEHCQSVLGPAAYLVDLLQYLDLEPAVWNGFLTRWKADHGGSDYGPAHLKPYDALVQRRPDLPHLELTCENTMTELPYIDVVNEILEFYVAHGSLNAAAAHDIDGASSEDLVAEPQYIVREAYDAVLAARYPLTLPFDLWLETVRQFCLSFDTPLARVLEVLRPTDALFEPTAPYDREAVFRESLGLSPAEAALLTDPAPLDGDAWYDLYGLSRARAAVSAATNAAPATVDVADADAAHFAVGNICTYLDTSAGSARHGSSNTIGSIGAAGSAGAGATHITFTDVWDTAPEAGDVLLLDAPAALRSAKYLARKLEVTYQELVSLVETGFVNPQLPALGLLRTLGVSIADARFATGHAAFFTANKDLIGAERSSLDAAGQARFDALGVADPATGRTGWQDLADLQGFEERLSQAATRFSVPVDALRGQVQALPFDAVLVLADPDAGCDFDRTFLRHADGTAAEPLTFLRINLFVRLWRALGWSMPELDAALRTFVPSGAPFDAASLAQQPLRTALICLAHLKTLDERLRRGPDGRLGLLSFWSDISSAGPNSVYARLFLTPAVLRRDDVFDSPLGAYLFPQEMADEAGRQTYRAEAAGVAPADKLDPALFAGKPKLALRYDPLEQVQHLSYQGVLDDPEKQALLALLPAPSALLSGLLETVQAEAARYPRISGHLPALQGALGLTADEIAAVLSAPRPPLATAELSLANVSLLYRYAVLARGLRLSVRDVLRLQELSGLDPFTPLPPGPLTTLDQDSPFSGTLQFVGIADEVAGGNLSLDDLDYLLRHRYDPVGAYRQNPAETLSLLTGLADGIRAIRAEHAVPADPGALTEEVLRQKLGLVLPPEVSERFLSLLAGTTQYAAARTGIAPAAALAQAVFAGEPAIAEVRYDATTQTQRLGIRGVLFDERKARLVAAFADKLTAAQQATFAALLDDVQVEGNRQANAFFGKHLEKQQVNDDTTTGFLDPADFALLLDPDLPLTAGETPAAREAKRRRRLAESFLPFLQRRLIREFVLGGMTTAHPDADPELLTSLLTDGQLLTLSRPTARPLLDVITGAAATGISATFFGSADLSGAALGSATLPDADLALVGPGGPLTPAGTNSARLQGYLQVPSAGAYRFYVPAGKKDAAAKLRFADLPAPTLAGTAAADSDVIGSAAAQYAVLSPGLTYRFTLDLTNLQGGTARLLVQSETLPKDRLAQLTLYPSAPLDGAVRADVLLGKALKLLGACGLGDRDARYLLTHPGDFGGLDLALLPTRPADVDAARATVLFGAFRRLLRYAGLRQDLAGGTADLIDVFEAAGRGDPGGSFDVLARLTRRDRPDVEAAARAVYPAPVLGNDETVQRVWEVLQVVQQFGVPVGAVQDWTRIIRNGAGADERFGVAADLKNALRARFDAEQWRRAAQPVFDRLRRRQRDALVRYVQHRQGFTTPDQLYEYFLIDPGMEPVVQTSRIRLAIASVQLFIQRCLLNLEPKVPPGAILNAGHWAWMKRYRVWEANRKIFLYPENYLEPEFRDNKTHQFTELEGSLLQGDVSADLVEDAFLGYLRKLDALARLDIVAMHLEEKDDPRSNVLHVIGRTYGTPHQYHYRRYAHGGWSAWLPVPVEIEGDHLAPVVWRDRLYLFWLTFAPKAAPTGASTTVDFKTPVTVPGAPPTTVEASLHWCEYVGGEWSPPQSTRPDQNAGQILTATTDLASVAGLLVSVSKEPEEDGQERGVYIHLGEPFSGSFYLAGRNSAPEVSIGGAGAPDNPFSAWTVMQNRYTDRDQLLVTYSERISSDPEAEPESVSPPILGHTDAYALLPTDNSLLWPEGEVGTLVRPVFFQDNRNTFFVEPTLSERTVRDWQEWVTPPPPPEPGRTEPEWWTELVIRPVVPVPKLVPRPDDPWRHVLPDEAKFTLGPTVDWLTNARTTVHYGDQSIGLAGRVDVASDGAVFNQVGASGVDAALHQNLRFLDAGAVALPGLG